MARPEAEHPPAGHGVKIVEIPCSGKVDARVEPPAIPPIVGASGSPVIARRCGGWIFQRVGGDLRAGVALPR